MLRRWVAGRYVGMDNLDMRCPGEPESRGSVEDVQVELCHKLAKRWSLSDRLIAEKRWGADESKATVTAISRRVGFGRTKVENRIAWIQDCVIEVCVKNVNIYP